MAQILLVLFLVAVVNAIAFKHYRRWDFSRDQNYTLSDKTKRVLDNLKAKMRITVFFSPNTPITTDVQNLLTEYQYAGHGKIDVENIDPERNLSRAKELFDKYKVVTDESLLVLDYDGRNKAVKASEMADIDASGMSFGEGPRVAAFKGEQAITSAIMDLVEGKKNTIGYVTGHKEPPLSDSGPISVLKTFIENENIQFKELNLLDLDAIPAEVKAVMIIGPQYDFSDREMKLLRDYWEKQGRILLLLDPSAKTPKLRAFVHELGIKMNDDRLMAFLRTGIEELALTKDVQARFLGDSPITKKLADVRTLFLGGTSSLTLEPERVRAANIRLEPLIEAEKGYFAEADYNTDNQAKLQADAKQAANLTFTIGAAAEKGGSADQRVQMNSSRLVVVSNAAFVQDNAITQDQQGLDFVSGSLNWLL
ncbi:MAG: GldG family protein, partial [Chthoniobacterales bacterium]|nr:GldG family protein [Chthoniobacterales bacterium]